jgi:heptaprenyl diphosphate synthase
MGKLAGKEKISVLENEVDLNVIYRPIIDELNLFKKEVKAQIRQEKTEATFSNEAVDYFFKAEGKLLRPALVILSAKAGLSGKETDTQRLIRLAVAVEFIHSASLVHDDIIDRSNQRRDQSVLHQRFGRQIAVLTGDMLFARAFSILIESMDSKINHLISSCVEGMCRGEIWQIQSPFSNFEEYCSLIQLKTAHFMSVCCHSGAILANADPETADALESFGLHFGMTYQLADDYIDEDLSFPDDIDLVEQAGIHQTSSIKALESIHDSEYKQSLVELTHYVLQKCQKRQHDQMLVS